MVSQNSPPNSASSILHQFIISDSIASQNQFENRHFDAYRTDLSSSGPYQRLSLSLSSDMLVPSAQSRQRHLNSNVISPSYFICGDEGREACNPGVERVTDEYAFVGSPFALSSTSLNQSFAIAVGHSKYLKPAQLLLEEVVNVGGKAVDSSNEKYIRRILHNSRRGSIGFCSELKAEWASNGLSGETHELQVKIVKLISLLEEVERRYEQYYHRLEEVISSFEVIAGIGAGKTYTALALQAMSRHFCSLRDAITSQIITAKRKFSLDMPKIDTGLSNLSLFDKEARNNGFSLQQLGMIQNQRQAWRPIRGLPETSLAILRSWLFEHFLHPYPNDSEKLMLASQTGLTKNQVSNWFINARVRLWKPMIEKMYKEEFADSSADSDQLFASTSLPRVGITDHADE